MIAVKNLSKIYKSKKQQTVALDGVSLNLPDSGMVFILGKSGCGKTTLLNMLGAMDTFDGGDIVVEGRALSSLSSAERDAYRNTYVGFIFQEYNLIEDFDVEQNIAVAQELQRKEPSDEEITALLNSLGLDGIEKRNISELSGGQRQRVAIARALIKSPRLLLCDEPTGALDSESGESLMHLLKDISRDRLVVVVSHDRDFAGRFGDRIIELKDGKVISDSSPAEDKAQPQNLSLTFARLKNSRAFAMGVRTAVKKPVRMTFSVLLLSLATFVLSLAVILAGFNYDISVVRTIINNGRDYNVSYMRYTTAGENVVSPSEEVLLKADDNMVEEYSGIYGVPAVGKIDADFGGECFAGSFADYSDWYKTYYRSNVEFGIPALFGGYMPISEQICSDFGFELTGNLPQDENEIVISQYIVRAFTVYGYTDGNGNTWKIESAEDMLGKRIVTGEADYDGTFTPQKSYIVSGVITNLDLDRIGYRVQYGQADSSSYYLRENLEKEFSFLSGDYLNDVCFVSSEKFAALKEENADYERTTGILRDDAVLGDAYSIYEYAENFITNYIYRGDTRVDSLRVLAEGDIGGIGLSIYHFGGQTALREGQAALTLTQLRLLIDSKRIMLSAEDAAAYGCDTLSDYINENLYTEQNVKEILLEYYFGGAAPGDGEMENMVAYALGELSYGYDYAYGINFARLCYPSVAPMVEKYLADVSIRTGGYDTAVKTFSPGGVLFFNMENVHLDYSFENGAICMSTADAEEITYNAYGNSYDRIVSLMPSSFGEVYELWSGSSSRNAGLRYVMDTFESGAVNDYVSSTAGNIMFFSVLGGVMALIAVLLMFNFITNSVALREKDVTILRNLGAGGREVCKIFYMESMITAVVSAVFAAALTAAGAYLFNRYFAAAIFLKLKCIVFEWWLPLLILAITLVITFAVTLLALIKNLKITD